MRDATNHHLLNGPISNEAPAPIRHPIGDVDVLTPAPPDRGGSSAAVWAFVTITVVAVLLTGTIGVMTWHRQEAERELKHLVKMAEGTGDAAEVIRVLELYLATHTHPTVHQLATERLTRARRELDDQDYELAQATYSGGRTSLDAVEEAYRRYLKSHSDGVHRADAQSSLDRLETQRDDFAFEDSIRVERANPHDYQEQQRAWEVYLASYPKGRHAPEARARLAGVPDQIDKDLYLRWAKKIQESEGSNRLVEALDFGDQAMGEVKSASRRESLVGITKPIESKLEEQDADACLGPMMKSSTEREEMRRTCKLFLLCYPESLQRSKVEHRIQEIGLADQRERWERLEAELKNLKGQPSDGLRLLEEYQEMTGDYSKEVMKQVNTFEWRSTLANVESKLKSAKNSLKGMRVVRKRDGSTLLTREIDRASGQILVRDMEGNWSKLEQKEVVRIEKPMLTEQIADLIRRMRSRPDSFNAIPEALKRKLQDLFQAAPVSMYSSQRRSIKKSLALINTHLKAARRRLRRAERHTEPDLQNSDSQGRTRVRSAGSALRYYERVVDSKEKAQQIIDDNTPKYTYRLLGRRIPVSVAVKLLSQSISSKLLSSSGDPFHGKIVQEFGAQAVRLPDAGVPKELYSEVDEELLSVSSALKVIFEHEVRSLPQQVAGVGVVLRKGLDARSIKEIIEGTASDKAGLESGDLIVAVDGAPVRTNASKAEIETLIANGRESGVELLLRRSDRRFRVTLAKSDYRIHRYEHRVSCKITPSTAFGEKLIQTDWSDVAPPP